MKHTFILRPTTLAVLGLASACALVLTNAAQAADKAATKKSGTYVTGDFHSDLTKPAIDHIEFSNIENTELDANQPHILLKGLRLPFVFMRHYDMKLIFEKAGAVDLTVSVGI